MSRGEHAGPRKPRRRLGAGARTVLTVLGLLVGLAGCAALGWYVVMLTMRVGVLAGAGALVGGTLVVVLAWLAISQHRARRTATPRS